MHWRSRRYASWSLWLCCALLLAVSACQAPSGSDRGVEVSPTVASAVSPSAGQGGAASTATIAASAATAANPESAGTKPTPTAASAGTLAPGTSGAGTSVAGTSIKVDPAAGLKGLGSYHQQYQVAVQGLAAGKAVASSQKLDHWVNGADEARLIDAGDGADSPVHLRTASLGGYLYSQQVENGACRASPASESAQPVLDPTLPTVSSAREMGTEVLNSVTARRYSFDETAVRGIAGANGKAQGSLWVADDGGYLLKYELTVDVVDNDFQGKRTWSYVLDGVGQRHPITLPQGCLAVPSEFPVLADAAGLERGPAYLKYTTGKNVLDAARFYQQQLPSQGWQALPGVEPSQSGASLAFSRARDGGAGDLAVVTVQPSQSQTQVVVQMAATKQPVKSALTPAATPGSGAQTAAKTPTSTSASLPIGLPRYPGAQVALQNERTIMLNTSDSPAKVLSYYQTELKKAGWSMGNQNQAGPTTTQSWTRGGDTILLAVMQNGAQTRVVLTAQGGE